MIVSGPERQVTTSVTSDVMAGGAVTAFVAFCREHGYQSLTEPHHQPKATTFLGHSSALHSIGVIPLGRCALRPGQDYALELDFRAAGNVSEEGSYTVSLGYLPSCPGSGAKMSPSAAAKVMQQLIDHLAPSKSDSQRLNVSLFGRIED
jgi:hypothetical protein